ncbi:PLP-dependent aminotransferase family protein [Actinomadura sp. DC4]|uniref:MocR-like pyridoxine biosynthesis transcription factor PdxR n=1 Tax=Actinomadura sp. DC4 TaxID=3055069 RepID=UPI0025B01299|nr:PLP-dependent aminotransferase family protein [Actinomadura sp. DC4]MDN3351388.1 PLP-dependent aminotransferase family protein [Actinomadura sp. DC4]
MDFHVSLGDRRDLTGQIYRQLRAAILDGRLRVGDALPPTRELARRLGVARNTVAVAYDRLASEGFVTSRVGAGTFVHATGPASRRAPASSPLRPRAVWDSLAPWPDWLDARPAYDFRVGLPDPRLFPYETWRRLTDREPGPADPAGHARLRAAIARHIGVSRGVRAGADDVIVTNGIQQALDLVGRALLEPGDRVAVERPGYPPARMLFRSLGLRVVGVPVDAEGLRVDALPPDVRAVYVTPSHQFPLGMTMSLARRTALLEWAGRRNAAVIEDDYDSEFRYGGRPVEPLQNLDHSGLVLYTGSFTKVLAPRVRIGYLVAPASLRAALTTARFVTDWHSPAPAQAALARFIDDGDLARHVRRMRQEYEERHGLLLAALGRDFAGLLEPVPSAAGLHVSAFTATDPGRAAERARAAGAQVHTLAEVSGDPDTRPGLALGYGAIPAARIGAGLRILHDALSLK